MHTLEGVSSVANLMTAYENLNKTDTHIFYLKCVLCFQRQPFLFLFYFTAAAFSALWLPFNISPHFTIVQIILSYPLVSLGPLW